MQKLYSVLILHLAKVLHLLICHTVPIPSFLKGKFALTKDGRFLNSAIPLFPKMGLGERSHLSRNSRNRGYAYPGLTVVLYCTRTVSTQGGGQNSRTETEGPRRGEARAPRQVDRAGDQAGD